MADNGGQGAGAGLFNLLQEEGDGSVTGPVPPTGDPMNLDGDDASDPKSDPLSANSTLVWDLAPLRLSATAVGTVQILALPQGAPIPSPLAPLGRRQTELVIVVDETVASVRDLWHLCANSQHASGDNQIRHEIGSGQLREERTLSLDDADVGFIAWIERASTLQQDEMQVSDEESSDEEGPPAADTLRHRWVTRGNKDILKISGSQSNLATSGDQSEVLNLRRSQRTDGEVGHFIIHSSQSTLTVNGLRITPGSVAGPLPSFAVIEIGDTAVFWWRDPQSVHYLPQGPIKNTRKRSRILDPEEELEAFNDDDIPLTKRTKVFENTSSAGAPRRSERIASRNATRSADWTAVSRGGRTRPLHFKNLLPRVFQNPKAGRSLGPLPRNPPRDLPPGPRPLVKPGPQPPRTGKPPTRVVNEPLPTPRMSWRQQLQERLTFWRDERRRAQESRKAQGSNTGDNAPSQVPTDTAFQIPYFESLDDLQVILGIASVWRPLIDWGTDFAFGNQGHFQSSRLENHILPSTCVHSPHHFVIPLIFNSLVPNPPGERLRDVKAPPPKKSVEGLESKKAKPKLEKKILMSESNKDQPEKKNSEKGKAKGEPGKGRKPTVTAKKPNKPNVPERKKPETLEEVEARRETFVGGIGHFVLAVAEIVPGTNDVVRLTFWDSAPGNVSPSVIRASARNVVRNSDWMPSGVWPRFVEEQWPRSPRQGGNTCGLHVLLNAWAYMLNIPLNPNGFMSGRFYDGALEIINLALQGLMDAPTIRAFFHTYRYAAAQDFSAVQRMEESTLPDVPREMRHLPQTMRINERIFNEALESLRHMKSIQASAEEARKSSDPWTVERVPQKSPTPPGSTDGPTAPGGSTPPKSPHPPKDPSSPKDPSPPRTPSPRKRTPPKRESSSPKKQKSSPRKTASPTKGTPSAGPPKSGTSPTTRPHHTWEGLLLEGIARQRDIAMKSEDEKKSKQPKKKSYFLKETGSGALDDDQVGYAIASMWQGLRVWTAGQQSGFAFGDPVTFRINRASASGVVAVGRPHPLIIPMLFPANEYPEQHGRKSTRDVGGIGHFVLGIAEREGNDVKLFYMDSSPGSIHARTIRDTARALVRYTGWMGIDANGDALPATPRFVFELTTSVPAQRLSNNCGFHVIINAWCHMLGIPIHRGKTRRRDATRGAASYDEEFYVLGKEIINLAMRGYMDSRTIQAFLNLYGYSQSQDPNNLDHRVRTVVSQRMTTEILQNLMRSLREQEAAVEMAKFIASTYD